MMIMLVTSSAPHVDMPLNLFLPKTIQLPGSFVPSHITQPRHALPATGDMSRPNPIIAHATTPSTVTEPQEDPSGNAVMMVTSDTYDDLVLGAEKVIVYFTAPWCGPCKRISPTVQTLSQDFEGLSVYTYDITTGGGEKAKALGIRSLPWFMIYRNGELLHEFSTVRPADLQTEIEGLLF